jgi:hypothetical protein
MCDKQKNLGTRSWQTTLQNKPGKPDKVYTLKSESIMAIVGFLIISLLFCLASGLQPGDRVSTLTQSRHMSTKTEWMDVPLHLMPKFGVPENHIFHVSIPKYAENSTDYRINPKRDLKVAFTFMGNKLSIPWVSVYNAEEKVSMKKLIITFTHDEFELVRIRYTPKCKDFSYMVFSFFPGLYIDIFFVCLRHSFVFRWR